MKKVAGVRQDSATGRMLQFVRLESARSPSEAKNETRAHRGLLHRRRGRSCRHPGAGEQTSMRTTSPGITGSRVSSGSVPTVSHSPGKDRRGGRLQIGPEEEVDSDGLRGGGPRRRSPKMPRTGWSAFSLIKKCGAPKDPVTEEMLCVGCLNSDSAAIAGFRIGVLQHLEGRSPPER